MGPKAICACQPSRVAGEGTSLCRVSTVREEVRLANAKANGVRKRVWESGHFCQEPEGFRTSESACRHLSFAPQSIKRLGRGKCSAMSEVSAGGGTPVASAIEPDGATNRLLTPEAMVRQIKRYVATIRRCLPGVSDPENVVADVLLSFWERRLWPVPEPYVWAAVMYAAVSALRRRATEARKYQRLGVEFDEGHRMLRPQSERRSA